MSRGGRVATQEKSQLRRIPESGEAGNCRAQGCHARLRLLERGLAHCVTATLGDQLSGETEMGTT